MGERLRGKGNYTVAEIMAFSSHEDDWRKLEALLNQDYVLGQVIIENSNSEGWGINYRVGNQSLCYIHPERDALFIAFQICEDAIEAIKQKLSPYAIQVWENRYPCGKGGWMWYRLTEQVQIDEVRLLLNQKIKPSK